MLFENRGTVPSLGGTFSLSVSVGSFIPDGRLCKEGLAPNPVPSSHPCMPLPYSDDFESYVDSSEARYFADQIGAFEI